MHQKLVFWCAEVNHLLFSFFSFFPFLLGKMPILLTANNFGCQVGEFCAAQPHTHPIHDLTEDLSLGLVKLEGTLTVCAHGVSADTAKLPFWPWQFCVGFILRLTVKEWSLKSMYYIYTYIIIILQSFIIIWGILSAAPSSNSTIVARLKWAQT